MPEPQGHVPPGVPPWRCHPEASRSQLDVHRAALHALVASLPDDESLLSAIEHVLRWHVLGKPRWQG
jgi:hypothetical protein